MIRFLLMAACLLRVATAFAQTGDCPDGAPGWVGDKNTGCKHWSYCSRQSHSVTWSGACISGLAEGLGVQQWFDGTAPADRYTGANARRQAEGTRHPDLAR